MVPRWKTAFAIACAAAALTVAPLAHAGRSCEARAPSATQAQYALTLAQQLFDRLEQTKPEVAILGRVGSDQTKRGLHYTHLGFVVRDHPKGRWTVVHQLNACGSSNSELFDEGLGRFFLDEMHRFETALLIPSAPLQARLAQVLNGPLPARFHQPIYSAIANPFVTDYQNSNGWVVELVAAAYALQNTKSVSTRAEAQQLLRQLQYRPTEVEIDKLERAGARLFTANVRFGDHGGDAWARSRYAINSADGVLQFIERLDRGAMREEIFLDLSKPLVPVVPSVTRVAVAAPVPQVVAQIVEPFVPVPPTMPAAPPVNVAPPVSAVAAPAVAIQDSPRLKLLQSIRGLVSAYACRDTGYLAQCRGLAARSCEAQINRAVSECFATVSDEAILKSGASGSLAMVQDIGFCAVNLVDQDQAATPKRTLQFEGKSCQSPKAFQ